MKFQKTVHLKNLLVYIGGTLAAAGLSAWISDTSLDGLIKPPLTPPAWAFPVVWSILYVLMGYAAYRISVRRTALTPAALSAYWIQLAVNVLWPILFFRLELRLFAFFWLLLLIALVVTTIRRFAPIDRTASLLLLPYAVWCGFAAYLNLGFYLLNR